MRSVRGPSRISEETLTIVREQVDEAAFAEAWEQGRTLTAAEAVTLALVAEPLPS